MSEQNNSYSTLTLAYDDALALITLNRPEKRNAISYELIDDVLCALDEVAISPAQILDTYRKRQSLLFGDGPRQPALYRRAHGG